MAPTTYLFQNLFTPPYRFLPLAVFAFFVLSFLLHPTSVLYTGQLNDPDDYMRLNQVLNWLQGQSWFDTSQPRLSPGHETIIHWSRLVDIPLALIMLPLMLFWEPTTSALVTSFIVPLLLMGGLLTLVAALAKPSVGKERAPLACLFVLFAPLLLFNFTPGRVDHHAYQILIAGLNLFCLQRLFTDAKAWRYAVIAGGASACGLAIGTEAMPWLFITLAALGCSAAWRGDYLLRHSAIFGAIFAVMTAFLFVITVPPTDYSSWALSWFSSAAVLCAALTAFVFIVIYGLGQHTESPSLRLGLLAILGFFAVLIFALKVESVWGGPFANYESFNATTALDNINEARPLWQALSIDSFNKLTYWRALSTFISMLVLPLTALIVSFWNIATTKRHERGLWLLHGIFLLSATLFTLFWQIRVGYFMQFFAIVPLTWLLVTSWQICVIKLKGRPRFWAKIALFIALAPLCVLLIPAAFKETKFYPDMVLFPAAHSEITCPLQPIAPFLNQRYQGQDVTIMSGMNEGPELLFRTPFKAIGGNYNVSGNQDVFAFFNARDDKKAQALLMKWNATVILTCKNIAPFLAGMGNPQFGTSLFLKAGSDGKLHLTGHPKNPALLEKLVNNNAPNWLKPVEIPGNSDYFLYEVAKTGR